MIIYNLSIIAIFFSLFFLANDIKMNKSTLNDLADAIHSYYDANYSSNVVNDSFASSVNDIHKTKNMSHHENNNENNEESWGDDVEFITEGVLLITISILGFLGNSMSIYVLLRLINKYQKHFAKSNNY